MADPLPVPPPPPGLFVPTPGIVGVAYNEPPESILPSIREHLEKATKDLDVGDIALAAVADRQGGWNSTLVAKLPGGVKADVWIGKKWGQDEKLDWGARVLKVWKLGGDT